MKSIAIADKGSELVAALKNIPQPPKVLFFLGDIAPLLQMTVVSVVGSRAVTAYGKQITRQLSGDLAKRGVAIVSGLALGVDAIAHEAALEVGGYTVAVLPADLDVIYPATNRGLAERILRQGGAIISEYHGITRIPYKARCIERNRLVSGLCDGLLITEASERSGTMHTVNFALEQGKTVMAVPGNITSPTSSGTNNLIKTGATPITSIDDVLHALGINQQTNLATAVAANAEEAAILDQMQLGITDAGELLIGSKLKPDVFNQTLTMLEISAKIRPLGNGHWSLR